MHALTLAAPKHDAEVELAFAILELALLDTTLRARPNLPVIAFHLEGAIYSFDARRRGAVFLPIDVPQAELRVYTSARVLLGLALEPGIELDAGDLFSWEGDGRALLELAKLLRAPAGTSVDVRAGLARTDANLIALRKAGRR